MVVHLGFEPSSCAECISILQSLISFLPAQANYLLGNSPFIPESEFVSLTIALLLRCCFPVLQKNPEPFNKHYIYPSITKAILQLLSILFENYRDVPDEAVSLFDRTPLICWLLSLRHSLNDFPETALQVVKYSIGENDILNMTTSFSLLAGCYTLAAMSIDGTH